MKPTRPACLWCNGPMPEGASRGSPRRFCEPSHRRAYQTAARRYVDRLVLDGAIGPGELMDSRKARAPSPGQSRAIRVVWGAPRDFALYGPENGLGEFCDQYAHAREEARRI